MKIKKQLVILLHVISGLLNSQEVFITDDQFSVDIEYNGHKESIIRCSNCSDIFFKVDQSSISANKINNIIHYIENDYSGKFYLKSTNIHFESSSGDFIIFNRPNYHSLELVMNDKKLTFSKIGKTYVPDDNKTMSSLRDIILISVLLSFDWL